MNELIGKMVQYLADNTHKTIEADNLLEKFHGAVLDKLEDEYNF